MGLEEEFKKCIEESIQENKKRRAIIKRQIEKYLNNGGTASKVNIWFDHAGEHWQCTLCGSMLHTEFILDGEKRPNFCKECGVLLDWRQDDYNEQN